MRNSNWKSEILQSDLLEIRLQILHDIGSFCSGRFNILFIELIWIDKSEEIQDCLKLFFSVSFDLKYFLIESVQDCINDANALSLIFLRNLGQEQSSKSRQLSHNLFIFSCISLANSLFSFNKLFFISSISCFIYFIINVKYQKTCLRFLEVISFENSRLHTIDVEIIESLYRRIILSDKYLSKLLFFKSELNSEHFACDG